MRTGPSHYQVVILDDFEWIRKWIYFWNL